MPPKGQHTSQNGKGGNKSVTIAMVSTEQAEVGFLEYKFTILPVKIKARNGSNIIQTYVSSILEVPLWGKQPQQ